jgi:hypothetical protein
MRSVSQSWDDILVKRTQKAMSIQIVCLREVQSYRGASTSNGSSGKNALFTYCVSCFLVENFYVFKRIYASVFILLDLLSCSNILAKVSGK